MSTMLHKDFSFMLARLIREDVKKMEGNDQGIDEQAPASSNASSPSLIRRFINIDRAWDIERMILMLIERDVAWLDAMIAKCQKRVDDIPALPGKSRIKEIRKEKERDLGFGELRHLLPVRAIKQELEIIALKEGQPRIPERSFLERFPDTPKGREDLYARRDARLKFEAYENSKAKKKFADRMNAMQGGEGQGHWEFENEEEETVAHVFLRNTYDGEITPKDVLHEQLIEEKASVILSIRLKWVRDDTDVPGFRSGTTAFDREQGVIPQTSATCERDETAGDMQASTTRPPANPPSATKSRTGIAMLKRKHGSTPDGHESTSNKKQKASLIVKLPIRIPAAPQAGADATVKKRNERSSSDAMEAAASKKQRTTTNARSPVYTNSRQEIQYLADEIAKLTPAWLNWVYQNYPSTTIARRPDDPN